MQSGREDTLEEWYAIKFCFKLGRNATETYGMLHTAFWPSWLAKGLGLWLLCWGFKGVQEEIPSEEVSTFQIGSVAFPPGQCTSPQPILVADYLSKMGIKTVPQPPYSPYLAPCDFWLFPKIRGCRYEIIEEMEKAVTKVIDTLTQEDFDGAFEKLLGRYNKRIAAGGDYFEGK